MWLPTPTYERTPQFWFLIGLMFISVGVYIGFDYVLTVYYVGLGFICCGYGLGIYTLQLHHRQAKKENDHSAGLPE